MMLIRTPSFRTHRFHKTLLVLVILMFSVAVVAQSRTRSKKTKFNASNPVLRNWSIQGTLGFGSYYGDLSIYDSEPFSKFAEESKLSMGVVVSNKFLPFMGVQARLLWGRYQASSTVFNRKLDGNAYVGGVNLMVDIINLFSIPEEVFPEIYIYGVAGLGLMKMRPTISNLYSGEVIQGTHYQDKAEITPYFGIGFNKSMSKQWDLTIESILYNVNSDKLDGLYDDMSKDYLLYTSIGFKYNIKSLSTSSRNRYARSRAPLRR